MMGATKRFALDDELPAGRLAIEASAGTGKTFTLSTLAARFIAEGRVSANELLIVTFTRAAAGELKDRVRARLVEFAGILGQADLSVDQRGDPLIRLIWDTDEVTRAERLERVRRGVTEFDSATITTIHGFAQQVLGTLGVSVAVDPDAVLVDDDGSMVAQVVTDVMVAEAVRAGEASRLVITHEDLCGIVSTVLGNPSAVMAPEPDDEAAGFEARAIRSLVDEVISEIHHRRRLSGTMSFDDILLKLRDAVADPVTGPTARSVLARRFRVVMIDEFQDTDPVQWEIFDAIFGRGPADDDPDSSVMIFVGDPKQAIYAFRGANVHTYLQAARAPGTTRSDLGVNWRSDPGMLSSVEALFRGATFGDAEITFERVGCPDVHSGRRLTTRSGAAHPAISVRLLDGEGLPRLSKAGGRYVKAEADSLVYTDLARYVGGLLDTLRIPDDSASNGAGNIEEALRDLRPDDVAVLVSARYEASLIRRELNRLGIPAVVARGDNVLKSQAAQHWHRLLQALADPTDVRRTRSYALTWFGGHDASWVAEASDEQLARLQEQLHGWASMLADSGVAAVVGRIRAETGVAGRVLASETGDRMMTDVDHIGELLVTAGGHRPTASSLLSLYESLSSGTDEGEAETDLAARRVESEAAAVQIMTTFVSKGLEFPVVCVASMWKPNPVKVTKNIWWDPDRAKRVIDVASDLAWGDPETAVERKAWSAHELVGTNLRVLYVALTRARHHTVLWWLPRDGAEKTGLARILFARDSSGAIDSSAYGAQEVDIPSKTKALDVLAPVIRSAGGHLRVELVDAPTGRGEQWEPGDVGPEPVLGVAELGRSLPRDKRRWSFTAITRQAQGRLSTLDPTDETMGEGGAGDEDPSTESEAHSASTLPLGDIAGGAGFGTLVHSVFEHVDFAASDLRGELSAAVDEAMRWSPWDVDGQSLVVGLDAVIRTPLGALFAGRALRDLPRSDRLDELEFDLRLGLSGGIPTDMDIGALLVAELGDDDPMIGWARDLERGVFGVGLAGHLTGSIDLLARIREQGTPERFVVCDYKTNRIAGRGEPATGAHFGPDSLARAMAEAHYPLQALLYSVAVHRYLRWRVEDYDPGTHLGGVGYLFVRGMVGPDTPTHDGVPEGLFEWHPPSSAIVALSDLLDGRRTGAAVTADGRA